MTNAAPPTGGGPALPSAGIPSLPASPPSPSRAASASPRFTASREAASSAEGAKETATPPWLEWTGLKSMKTVPAMQDGKSVFLVTGDPARNKEQCVPGGGSATVKIVLPSKWNALMAEKGYEPLGKFTLKSDMRPDVPKPKVRGYDRPGVRADVGPGMRRPQGGRGPGMRRRRPSSDE